MGVQCWPMRSVCCRFAIGVGHRAMAVGMHGYVGTHPVADRLQMFGRKVRGSVATACISSERRLASASLTVRETGWGHYCDCVALPAIITGDQ